MTTELAKTLTTALVQFIDRERPDGTMCCSSSECEAIEQAFMADNFFYVETLVQRKLSRLTEFEEGLVEFYNERNDIPCDKDGVYNRRQLEDFLHTWSSKLLAIAKKELLKDDELGKKSLEGYIMGREDTMREMKDFVESHFNCENAKKGTPIVYNTQSGTAIATLDGNTSATDGKEHNPSFTD